MLTLRFVRYTEIENLGPARRVKKILDIVKENKVVLLEGRLKKEEEKDLIEITMEEIDEKFKGIELAVVEPNKDEGSAFSRVKQGFVNALLGDRAGFTIVGPAAVVKEIKKDPNKIELYTENKNSTVVAKKKKKLVKRK